MIHITLKTSIRKRIDEISHIKANYNYNIKKRLYYNITMFQHWINNVIGSETTIEYRIGDVMDNTISYTVKYYTNEQRKKSLEQLATENVNMIKTYMKNLSANIFNKRILHTLRSIKTYLNDDIYKLFDIYSEIGDESVTKLTTLEINIPKIQSVEYKIIKLKDGSTIRQFIDPYVNNYGVYVDYSKDINEFNYMFNGLHVFEHYVTYAWKKLSNKDIIYYNGSTFSNGICYVYTITKTIESIKERLIKSILFHIKSSNVEYIKKTNSINIETIRTISEAYNMRNITRLGRSDQIAFSDSYNPEVFAYWCSQPMNILVVTNQEITINVDNLNNFYDKYHVNNRKPLQRTINYFPKEVFYTHYNNGIHLYKKNINKICKKIYGREITKSFYGIGNRTVIYQNESEGNYNKIDVSNEQTFLTTLLFFSKYVSDKNMKKYIDNNTFPLDAIDFNEQSMYSYKFVEDVL